MALYTKLALRATQGDTPFKYLGVINDGGVNQGFLAYSSDDVLTKNAKFAVEFSHDDLVHLRSCLTNKYWVRSSATEEWIVAQGDQPVVDKTSWTCTLFRMDIDANNMAKFYHVQSGTTVRILNDGSARKMFLTIDPAQKTEAVSSAIDYDRFVVLPKFVAFKGSNGLFYKNYIGKDQDANFSVNDIGDPNIVCEIRNTSDGHISVRAANDMGNNVFWTCKGSSGEELIISAKDNPTNHRQMFDVIAVDKNKVALRNLRNEKFCVRANYKHQVFTTKDSLVARANGAVEDAYLEVVEPVFRRTVNVYEFNLKNARIYNQVNLFTQEHIWDNYTDTEQKGSAHATITTTKSDTYNNNITVSGTVSTTFSTGIPFIVEGKIDISATASYSRQWGHTYTETQQILHTLDVTLKPNKTAIAKGVATRGACDVPFSYVQKDYPTDGGPPRVTRLHDGIFTGTNAYSFHDEIRYENLPTYTGPPDLAPNTCMKRPVMMARRGKTILRYSNILPKSSRPLLAPLSLISALLCYIPK